MTYRTRITCRACSSLNLTHLFSLGEQYVSDFVEKDKVGDGVKCPISLDLCNACTLVQARHSPDQELLYRSQYYYRSGTTRTMRAALRDVTQAAESRVKLRAGDVVLDIGSNDGTLLRSYDAEGLIRMGVEPAKNLVEEGREGLDMLINDFWSADKVQGALTRHPTLTLGDIIVASEPKAKVITACGMMYDLEDPNQFIADVATVLAPDGIFIAQLMCLKQMMEQNDVGNLCHEHLEYYSLRSLMGLYERHGLKIVDLEENHVNGGSYRVYACHAGSKEVSARVSRKLMAEGVISDPRALARWFDYAQDNRDRCVNFIRREVAEGKKVWVYGASTKGNTVLQWYGLDSSLIQAASDKSPEKWGKYTVGTGIPIYSDREMRAANPDYLLVLPYAFLPEFMSREREWVAKGGKFLVPFPEFKVA